MLGFNRPVDAAAAEVLAEPGQFIEAIIAPGFDAAAIEILTSKPKWKANVRLLELATLTSGKPSWDYRPVGGGLLVQSADSLPDPEAEWQVVTKASPSDAQRAELRFAWNLVRHVKSNAIVLSKDQSLCGVGAGQMSHVDSTNIAIQKAGRARRRKCAGVGCLFSVCRFGAVGCSGRRRRVHSTWRVAQRRRSDRGLQPAWPADDLHRPPTLQTLKRTGKNESAPQRQ